MDLTHLLDIVVCPVCRRKLWLNESQKTLRCSRFHVYPVIDGKPILIPTPSVINLEPPATSITSRNVETFEVEWNSYSQDSLVLHLGSGNVPSADERVISVDVVPADNVDVVCEAELLPFRNNVFDLVSSGAVLEHVYDPIASAKEIWRVTKVGGRSTHTVAFMQPYHGFPSHYFNWTPVAMETYLMNGFECEISEVAENGSSIALTEQKCFSYRRSESSDSSIRAIKGDRFDEERKFFNQLAAEFSHLGWRNASRAAKLRVSSRAHALFMITKVCSDMSAIRRLLRHATSS